MRNQPANKAERSRLFVTGQLHWFNFFPPTHPEKHPITTGVPGHLASMKRERVCDYTRRGGCKVKKSHFWV